LLAGAALCGAATLFSVLLHPKLHSPRLDIVSFVLLGLCAFTALQIVPLPSGLVELLNPAVHEVRSRALHPLGDKAASFMPLSLDVSLTTTELVKQCLYLCVYWSCQAWIRYKGSRYISVLIAVAGALCAAVLLAHRVLMLDLVYGIYKPLHVALYASSGRVSAPLLNENHLSALLGMGTAIAIGLALEVQDRTHRTLAIVGSALIGGALLLTFSRGGIAAFVIGQLLFVVLRRLHRSRQSRTGEIAANLGWAPLGLAASLGLGFFVAQDTIVGEFMSGDVSKIDMARVAAPLIRDFWTTGVGRGAFWVAFAAYDPLVSLSTATHAENLVVQLLSDFGLVVGTAAIAAFLLVMVRELRDIPTRPSRAAALSAIVAFGVHNLVDFSIEVAGVAVIATACFCVLRFGGLRATVEPNEKMVRLPRQLAFAFAGLTAGVCALVPLLVLCKTVDEEERRFHLAYREADSQAFSRVSLRETLSRHPAVAFVPLVTGIRLYQRREGNPLPWLSRAIELSPHNAAAHLYVGFSLLRAGRMSQGLLELRLAGRYGPHLVPRIANLLVERYPKFEDASQIAVTDEERRELWPSLADALAQRNLTEEAAKADRAILALDPHAPRSLARSARRQAASGDMDQAFASVRALARLPGQEAAGALLDAELHASLGEHADAVKTLEKQALAQPRHTGVLAQLAWAKFRAGDRKGALECAATLRNLADTPQARAAGYALEGELELASGNIRTAMSKLRDAHSIDGARTNYLWRIADLAKSQGDEASLIDALRKIAAIDPSDERARSQLADLTNEKNRQLLLGESLKR
jgi:hypothetical protein